MYGKGGCIAALGSAAACVHVRSQWNLQSKTSIHFFRSFCISSRVAWLQKSDAALRLTYLHLIILSVGWNYGHRRGSILNGRGEGCVLDFLRTSIRRGYMNGVVGHFQQNELLTLLGRGGRRYLSIPPHSRCRCPCP